MSSSTPSDVRQDDGLYIDRDSVTDTNMLDLTGVTDPCH